MTVGDWLRKHGRKTANGVKPVCYFFGAIIFACLCIAVVCFACQTHPWISLAVCGVLCFICLCHLAGDLPGDEYRRR